MKKILIITNIPSPYRVDFFYYLQYTFPQYNISIVFSSKNEDNRMWIANLSKLKNYYFLKSFTLKIKGHMDTKYIHIPIGIGKLLYKISPEVIVGAEYNPTALQAINWCKKNKVSYITWTDGTLNSEKNINLLQKLARKYVIGNSKAYIASSSKSREAQIFYGANPDKIYTSYLTIDIDNYKVEHISNGIFSILFVGRLIKNKGVDLLFNALSKIGRKYTLYIAGDGPELSNLKLLAKQLNLENKVKFLGFLQQEELKKYYAMSDVFILPTLNDCFGLVILEAMCASLPVIVSKYADGAADLVINGENGFIIDPYDSDSMASVIKKLMDNRELKEQMGYNSGKFIEKFKFEKVADNFIAAIKESENEG